MENKKTILIVEDEKSLRSVLHDKLITEGFDVLDAENGEVGLDLAFSKHPDFIVSDIMMPKMDGIHMMEKLRNDDWGKTVPIIILTNISGDDEQMNKNITKYEPTYYFMKYEIKLEDLIEKIKERLGLL